MKLYAISSTGMLLLLAACGASTGPPLADGDSIIGAWRSQVTFRDGALTAMHGLEFMYVFNAGGTLTESSNYDGAPPVPPAYGVWRRVAPGRYEARYLYFTTQPPADWPAIAAGGGWNPTGHGELRETIDVGNDGRSFESTLSLALFDTTGKPAEGGGSATGHGTRIGF